MASGAEHYLQAEYALTAAAQADGPDDQTFYLLAALANGLLAIAAAANPNYNTLGAQ